MRHLWCLLIMKMLYYIITPNAITSLSDYTLMLCFYFQSTAIHHSPLCTHNTQITSSQKKILIISEVFCLAFIVIVLCPLYIIRVSIIEITQTTYYIFSCSVTSHSDQDYWPVFFPLIDLWAHARYSYLVVVFFLFGPFNTWGW